MEADDFGKLPGNRSDWQVPYTISAQRIQQFLRISIPSQKNKQRDKQFGICLVQYADIWMFGNTSYQVMLIKQELRSNRKRKSKMDCHL